MATEVGEIGALVKGVDPEQTPLERRLDALGHRLVWLALAVAGIVAVLGARAGHAGARMAIATRHGRPGDRAQKSLQLRDALEMALLFQVVLYIVFYTKAWNSLF
jgi:magnesium-transporting ATPase (P-type)